MGKHAFIEIPGGIKRKLQPGYADRVQDGAVQGCDFTLGYGNTPAVVDLLEDEDVFGV